MTKARSQLAQEAIDIDAEIERLQAKRNRLYNEIDAINRAEFDSAQGSLDIVEDDR